MPGRGGRRVGAGRPRGSGSRPAPTPEELVEKQRRRQERKAQVTITAFGKSQTAFLWGKELGLDPSLIRYRVRIGCSPELALSTGRIDRSPEKRPRKEYVWKGPRTPKERTCGICGIKFMTTVWHAKYCGTSCYRKSHAVQATGPLRRARKAGNQSESFDPHEIFMRDGWSCQICGVATPRRLRGTCEPNAPELDHVIPLAKGGPHTRANTQCSCRSCNGRKGAKIMGKYVKAPSEDWRCQA